MVLASSILMLFSVGVYSGLASALGPAADEVTFASVVALANGAIEHGSASASLYFGNASIACSSGTLTFATADYSQNSSMPVSCSFPPQHVDGATQLTFEYSEGLLTLRVE